MPAQLTARPGSVKGKVIRDAVLRRPALTVPEFARFCIPRPVLAMAEKAGSRGVARRNNPQTGPALRLGVDGIGAADGQILANGADEPAAPGISAQHA